MCTAMLRIKLPKMMRIHHLGKLDLDPDPHRKWKAVSGSASKWKAGSASKLKMESLEVHFGASEGLYVWEKVSGRIRIRIIVKSRIRNTLPLRTVPTLCVSTTCTWTIVLSLDKSASIGQCRESRWGSVGSISFRASRIRILPSLSKILMNLSLKTDVNVLL